MVNPFLIPSPAESDTEKRAQPSMREIKANATKRVRQNPLPQERRKNRKEQTRQKTGGPEKKTVKSKIFRYVLGGSIAGGGGLLGFILGQ